MVLGFARQRVEPNAGVEDFIAQRLHFAFYQEPCTLCAISCTLLLMSHTSVYLNDLAVPKHNGRHRMLITRRRTSIA